MKLVGAGLDGGIDDGAVAAPEFRAISVGLDLEFFQRFHRRLNHIVGLIQQIRQIGIVVHSIQQEIVLQGARAIS